jgi:O-antigen ligase
MARNTKSSSSSDWFDADLVNDKPSRLSGIVFFLVAAILVFTGVAYGAVDLWALAMLSAFAALIVIFWTADAFVKKEFQFNANLLLLPILGLLLIGLIQLLPLGSVSVPDKLLTNSPPVATLSLDPYSTRFGVMHLIIYLIFFAAALTFINNQKRLRKIVFTIIIFGAIMGFFGILQELADPDAIYGLRPTPQADPFASFVNKHHFAAFMEMTIALTLALLFGKAAKKDKNILLIIAAVLMGISIVFTGSRGGFISLVGVLGFVIAANILQRRKEKKDGGDEEDEETTLGYGRNFALVGGGLALILVLFGSAFLLGGDQALLRGVGIEQSENMDVTSGRTHFWQVALKIILANPILGTGINSFGVAYTKYDTWNGYLRVEQAHNDYLQTLSDTGILGFACIAAFIFLLFRQSLRIISKVTDGFRRNAAVGALAGCFGILLHSFFDFPLRTPSNTFFFLTLTVIATASINYPKLYRKKRRTAKAA